MQGRLQVRLQFEGLFIGIQCRFQLAAARQGITAIVVRAGRAAFGEAPGRCTVVAGLVEGQALLLRVFEAFGGVTGTLLAQQRLALLIGA